MRISGPDFGPFPLILIRVGGAALILLPVLFTRKNSKVFRKHWRGFVFVGVIGTALPFCLFAYATLTLEAGFTSLLNAVTPMFTALIAAIWFGAAFRRVQILGLVIAFFGVAILSWDRFSFEAGGAGWPILAAFGATVTYGLSANFSKKFIAEVPPKTIAAGTLLFGGISLLPLGIWFWPDNSLSGISTGSWACAICLAAICTALALLMFFRVLAGNGAMAATTVTFLIPIFGLWWGWLILDEAIGIRLVIGMIVILLGTAMAIGVVFKNSR